MRNQLSRNSSDACMHSCSWTCSGVARGLLQGRPLQLRTGWGDGEELTKSWPTFVQLCVQNLALVISYCFSPTMTAYKIQLARSWPRVGHVPAFDMNMSVLKLHGAFLALVLWQHPTLVKATHVSAEENQCFWFQVGIKMHLHLHVIMFENECSAEHSYTYCPLFAQEEVWIPKRKFIRDDQPQPQPLFPTQKHYWYLMTHQIGSCRHIRCNLIVW